MERYFSTDRYIFPKNRHCAAAHSRRDLTGIYYQNTRSDFDVNRIYVRGDSPRIFPLVATRAPGHLPYGATHVGLVSDIGSRKTARRPRRRRAPPFRREGEGHASLKFGGAMIQRAPPATGRCFAENLNFKCAVHARHAREDSLAADRTLVYPLPQHPVMRDEAVVRRLTAPSCERSFRRHDVPPFGQAALDNPRARGKTLGRGGEDLPVDDECVDDVNEDEEVRNREVPSAVSRARLARQHVLVRRRNFAKVPTRRVREK